MVITASSGASDANLSGWKRDRRDGHLSAAASAAAASTPAGAKRRARRIISIKDYLGRA
jgi:hypothetical protein